MTESDAKYRLGLDLGTNSIGWAAVKLGEDGEPCGVLDMGVRVFPDGRNPRDGSSNAVQRRVPRGQRRRRDRYLKRRAELMEALIECGLMPEEEGERKALEGLDPYELRALALDQPLMAHQLGRALFHLDQRRGFKSNRKAGGEDESEAKKTRAEIGALRKRIEDSGARTLGELLARRHERGETVRARPGQDLYPERAMYETEFDAIRAAQASHHGLSESHWDSLKQIIFFQRPLEPVDPGWCQLERGEQRAPKALPVAQEFRMLQEVNNLRVRVGSAPERSLDGGERERAMAKLRSGRDITLRKGKNNEPVKPTTDLDLPPGAIFNLGRGGRKSVEGDATAKRLMNRKKEKDEKKALELFGSRWLDLYLDERNEIVNFMLDTEEPEEVRRKAVEEWGLNDTQGAAVANVSLPDGYANLSEKAMRKLLPYLEKGCVYSDAVIAAGYQHHSDWEAHDRLPYYGKVLERDVVGADPKKDPETDGESVRYGRIGNPTVHIGLGQLRRVVNRLMEVYGKPQEVVVELARDLKSNREQRQNYERQQREGGERNERFREMLESSEEAVTPDVLRKLRLWEEQGPEQARVCPYTGKPLSFSMVVSSATEVDHILPFSRTLDDSMANKVVCIAAPNRDKGDRSPFEAFGHSPPGYDYEEILDRAAKLPDNKRWRFREDAMERFEDESEFLDRQLNETRYLSRSARTYLAHLYDEKTEGKQRVRVIPGRMTALLRRGWGLEGILRADDSGVIVRKQRDDHRHHAIDAFVIANTTQGLLQRFAQAAGSSHDSEERLTAVAGKARPWDGFRREEIQPLLDRMVVSYKPDHGTRGVPGKTTGQLHNDTAYGLIELSEDGASKVVVRKKLGDMKRRGDLDSVRDAAMRAALLELWDSVGGKVGEFAEKAANEGVMLNGGRQPVRRVRVVDEQRVIPIRDGAGKAYKGYLPDSNAFASVWRMHDGSWAMVAVPTFYANQTKFDSERFRPVDKLGRRAVKQIMRLQIDDMGALGNGPKRRIVRVRKVTNAKTGVFVVLDDHNEANVAARKGKDMKENNHSARQLQRLGFRKVGVDEIGRVLDPGPPEP